MASYCIQGLIEMLTVAQSMCLALNACVTVAI